jgi:hypothetical protein
VWPLPDSEVVEGMDLAYALVSAVSAVQVALVGAGQVLDVGRERRLFTGPLRRALILRDRGCE